MKKLFAIVLSVVFVFTLAVIVAAEDSPENQGPVTPVNPWQPDVGPVGPVEPVEPEQTGVILPVEIIGEDGEPIAAGNAAVSTLNDEDAPAELTEAFEEIKDVDNIEDICKDFFEDTGIDPETHEDPVIADVIHVALDDAAKAALTNEEDGKLTISVPYELNTDGEISVMVLNENGEWEVVEATYEDGVLTITSPTDGVFAIVVTEAKEAEEIEPEETEPEETEPEETEPEETKPEETEPTKETEPPKETEKEEEGSSNVPLYVGIGAGAVVAAGLIGFFAAKSKKKKDDKGEQKK